MKKTIVITVALLSVFAVCACSVFATTEIENYPNSNGNGFTSTVLTSQTYDVAFNTSNTITNLRGMVHTTDFNDFLYDQWYEKHYGSVGNTNNQLITIYNTEGVSDYGCITICYEPYVNLGTYAVQADYHSLIQAILPLKASLPIDYIEISLRNVNATYGYTEDVFAYTGLVGLGNSVQHPDEELRYDYTGKPRITNLPFVGDTFYPPIFRICVDIYFQTDVSQNFWKVYNDVQLDVGSITIQNSKLVWTGGGEDGGGTTNPSFAYPPEWNHDIYPRPTDPEIVEDKYYQDQLIPKLYELTQRINALYQSIQGWIVDIADAFGSIVVLYDSIVLRMPLLGSLVDVSLYIGLCAFVLGSSVLTIITRRR